MSGTSAFKFIRPTVRGLRGTARVVLKSANKNAMCTTRRGHHMRHRDVLHLRDVVLFDDCLLWRRRRCLSAELSEALLAADPRRVKSYTSDMYNS